MAANDRGLRIVGTIVWSIGLALVLALMFLSAMGLKNIKFTSTPEAIVSGFLHVLIVPGIVPLLVSLSLLVFFRKAPEFFLGLFVAVPAMLVFHYVVVAASAHVDDPKALVVVAAEIVAGAGVLLLKAHRRGPFRDSSRR